MAKKKPKHVPYVPTPEQIAKNERDDAEFARAQTLVKSRTREQVQVQSSTYTLRQIATSEWHLPAFQRSYVWTEEQAIAMVERLLKGLPIGNLLSWTTYVERERFRILLDGQHRLITLGAKVYRDGVQVVGHVPLIDLETLEVTCTPGPNRVTIAWILQSGFSDYRQRDAFIMGVASFLKDHLQNVVIPITEIGGWKDTTMDDALEVYQCYNAGGTPIIDLRLNLKEKP